MWLLDSLKLCVWPALCSHRAARAQTPFSQGCWTPPCLLPPGQLLTSGSGKGRCSPILARTLLNQVSENHPIPDIWSPLISDQIPQLLSLISHYPDLHSPRILVCLMFPVGIDNFIPIDSFTLIIGYKSTSVFASIPSWAWFVCPVIIVWIPIAIVMIQSSISV